MQLYWLIPLVLIWLYIGRTTVNIKPFKIHIDAPALLIGVILISIGLILVKYQIENDAKKEAIKEVIELIENQEQK